MLELKNISFEAPEAKEKKEIIKNISLKIESGTFTAITGPNGGGKSTLAKLITGIYTPLSGQIIYNGKDITSLSVTERAKEGISFAFQQPVRFKGLKVKDILSLAGGGDMTVARSCEFLSAVGLCARDYIDRDLDSSLSGGEIKRIEIATLLARNSDLSVLDEPEAGIDLWSFANLVKVFEKMRENNKDRTILIISHQERILDIADEIIVLNGGEIAAKGEKKDILPELLKGMEGCRFYK